MIVGGGVLLAILLGWFTTWQSLKVARAETVAAAEREARAVQITLDCQANRAAFEEKLDGIVENVNLIASKKDRMQGALDAASIRTKEIAAARDALERLESEHAALVERAVPLDACQTYEMVLAAIAGGPHVQ